jgi:hypothetical protein
MRFTPQTSSVSREYPSESIELAKQLMQHKQQRTTATIRDSGIIGITSAAKST